MTGPTREQAKRFAIEGQIDPITLTPAGRRALHTEETRENQDLPRPPSGE